MIQYCILPKIAENCIIPKMQKWCILLIIIGFVCFLLFHGMQIVFVCFWALSHVATFGLLHVVGLFQLLPVINNF
jgi:hypothetical protein